MSIKNRELKSKSLSRFDRRSLLPFLLALTLVLFLQNSVAQTWTYELAIGPSKNYHTSRYVSSYESWDETKGWNGAAAMAKLKYEESGFFIGSYAAYYHRSIQTSQTYLTYNQRDGSSYMPCRGIGHLNERQTVRHVAAGLELGFNFFTNHRFNLGASFGVQRQVNLNSGVVSIPVIVSCDTNSAFGVDTTYRFLEQGARASRIFDPKWNLTLALQPSFEIGRKRFFCAARWNFRGRRNLNGFISEIDYRRNFDLVFGVAVRLSRLSGDEDARR